MHRKLFKTFVFIIAILSVNLLTNWLDDRLTDHRRDTDPLTFTLIGMGVILVIFYPLFTWLDGWVETLAGRFLHAGKALAGRTLGLVLTFLVALDLLLYLYARMWYGIDIHPLIIRKVYALFT